MEVQTDGAFDEEEDDEEELSRENAIAAGASRLAFQRAQTSLISALDVTVERADAQANLRLGNRDTLSLALEGDEIDLRLIRTGTADTFGLSTASGISSSTADRGCEACAP